MKYKDRKKNIFICIILRSYLQLLFCRFCVHLVSSFYELFAVALLLFRIVSLLHELLFISSTHSVSHRISSSRCVLFFRFAFCFNRNFIIWLCILVSFIVLLEGEKVEGKLLFIHSFSAACFGSNPHRM